MSFDYQGFLAAFPEFKNATRYPEARIEMCYDMATTFINDVDSPCRTLNGKRLKSALNMLTAHILSILYQNQKSAAVGRPGSNQGGFTTGATVGEVSVQKMAPPAANGWEYWLSSTPYGQMLWALLLMLGTGGLAVGGLPEREAFRKFGGVFL